MSADRKRTTMLCDDINCCKVKDLEAVIWKKAVRNKQKEEGKSLNKMFCCSPIWHAEKVIEHIEPTQFKNLTKL